MMDAPAFQSLVEAYGANARRWPDDRSEAATAFVSAAPDQAAAILALESELDDALDVLRPPAASASLRERVLAAAPRPRSAGRGALHWLRPGFGLAMAASCAAGVAAGLLLVSQPERGDTGGDAVMAALSVPSDVIGDDEEVG